MCGRNESNSKLGWTELWTGPSLPLFSVPPLEHKTQQSIWKEHSGPLSRMYVVFREACVCVYTYVYMCSSLPPCRDIVSALGLLDPKHLFTGTSAKSLHFSSQQRAETVQPEAMPQCPQVTQMWLQKGTKSLQGFSSKGPCLAVCPDPMYQARETAVRGVMSLP